MTVHIFNLAHLMCIYLQPPKIHCHYCNLQYENLYEIYNICVTAENKDIDYQLNFFFQVQDQQEGNVFCSSRLSSV